MMVLDVSRAHFHPFIKRELYVEIPEEDDSAGPDEVGLLLRTMYGTREASSEFEQFFTTIVEELGFRAGISVTCVYYRPLDLLIIWRHGDDIGIIGDEESSEQVYKELAKKMILKKRAVLGFGDSHDKTISLLNRIITLEVDAGRRRVVYEPDPRHIELLLHQFGFGKKTKGVATPSEKSKEYGDTTLLDESLHTLSLIHI